MKKKITILALHLGYGGVERCISSLANSLVQNEDYDIEIVSIYKLYDEPSFDINSNVKIKYLLPSSLNPNKEEWKEALRKLNVVKLIKESIKAIKILYKRRNEMIKYLKMTDSDVIISTRIMLNDWLGEYGKNTTLKIGWEHNHHHNNMHYATDVVRSAKNLDYLVLVSNDLFKFYRSELLPYKCKCVFIPNVIDKIPKTKSKLDSKRFISVGRLSPEKGYLDLLKIYKNLKNKGIDWKLDIVGDGSERETLEKFIKDNKLDNDVILHGFKKSDEIEKLMQKASIYIMCSYTESFGIVLLEAMSNGLPCIAFDSAEGAKEIITSGRDGYIIRRRNFEAMEKKIIDLVNDKDKRKELGNNGRIKVKQYTRDIIKEKWEAIISKNRSII